MVSDEESVSFCRSTTPIEVHQGISVSVNANFDSEIIDGSGIPNLRHLGSVEFFSAVLISNDGLKQAGDSGLIRYPPEHYFALRD